MSKNVTLSHSDVQSGLPDISKRVTLSKNDVQSNLPDMSKCVTLSHGDDQSSLLDLSFYRNIQSSLLGTSKYITLVGENVESSLSEPADKSNDVTLSHGQFAQPSGIVHFASTDMSKCSILLYGDVQLRPPATEDVTLSCGIVQSRSLSKNVTLSHRHCIIAKCIYRPVSLQVNVLPCGSVHPSTSPFSRLPCTSCHCREVLIAVCRAQVVIIAKWFYHPLTLQVNVLPCGSVRPLTFTSKRYCRMVLLGVCRAELVNDKCFHHPLTLQVNVLPCGSVRPLTFTSKRYCRMVLLAVRHAQLIIVKCFHIKSCVKIVKSNLGCFSMVLFIYPSS